jgi:hypothetical protein
VPFARVRARVRAELRDRREVEAREARGARIVQRAAGGRVGLRRQRRVVATVVAAVTRADHAECPRLMALVAAATRWPGGAEGYAEHHHALQRHYCHAGEHATAALSRVCVLRIEGGEIDVGPGMRAPAQL